MPISHQAWFEIFLNQLIIDNETNRIEDVSISLTMGLMHTFKEEDSIWRLSMFSILS